MLTLGSLGNASQPAWERGEILKAVDTVSGIQKQKSRVSLRDLRVEGRTDRSGWGVVLKLKRSPSGHLAPANRG